MAPAKQRAVRIFPDVLRQEQDLPFGNVTVFSDGKAGWMKSPQGTVGLPPAVAQQIRQEMFRTMLSLVLSDAIEERIVKGMGDGSVEISDKQGNQAVVHFDGITGLPSTLSYRTTPLAGAPQQVVETYTAWKSVNEVMLPFEYTIDQAGTRFAEGKITSYRLNTGTTVEELSKKP